MGMFERKILIRYVLAMAIQPWIRSKCILGCLLILANRDLSVLKMILVCIWSLGKNLEIPSPLKIGINLSGSIMTFLGLDLFLSYRCFQWVVLSLFFICTPTPAPYLLGSSLTNFMKITKRESVLSKSKQSNISNKIQQMGHGQRNSMN